MRILNPLIPREVCPFYRVLLWREPRLATRYASRVPANFSMSFSNSVLAARTLSLESVGFKERERERERERDSIA